jgi:adenylate kinase
VGAHCGSTCVESKRARGFVLSSMRRLVFLGGIPGCGKSTVGQALERQGLAIHVVAGALIDGSQPTVGVYQRPVVDLPDAADTQSLIVDRLRRMRRGLDTCNVLLDGHFVVPTRSGLYHVSSHVFESLQIDRIAMIHCEPNLAFERLRARGQREWWNASVAQMTAYQHEELAHAYAIASALGRQLHVIESTANPPRALAALFAA